MGFWGNLFNRNPSGIEANPNSPAPAPGSVGPPDWNPGDPEGVVLEGFDRTESRALPTILPSPWSGWPANWGVPNWDFSSKFNELVDVAWNCLDLNSSIMSAMPVYRTRNGEVTEPATWMANPDPTIYSSWHEFAKQLFWDYMLGEAFVFPMSFFSDGLPMRFRVIPPWLMDVEMRSGIRVYKLGGKQGRDVTGEILHIRYKSTTADPRGSGPLESAGGRMLTAGILAKYMREVVSTGGIPAYTLETADSLNHDEAQDLLEQWVTSRASNLGHPAVLDGGATLKTHQGMSPKDMLMIEIAQFNEAKIADLLGVPRPLLGLPTGDSLTYGNISGFFDFHDRASLRPKASSVMAALSNWALPRGQAAELNRDEYTRPTFTERASAWATLKAAGLITIEQFQVAERLSGPTPNGEVVAAAAITGGDVSE